MARGCQRTGHFRIRRITQSRYPISWARTLVGRDRELGVFDDLIAAGDSAVVVVSGEPGIGKTALIREVTRHARDRGYETLSARASEFERDLPFVAFADAFEGAVSSLPPERRELLDAKQLALLATVFPSHVGAVREAHPDERHLLLRALQELLELLASERPLLLALDDLQWADPASVDLVCRLLHRGLSGRALLLFASRPGQSETRMKAAFADAERHGQALLMELAPLSRAEAEMLLADGMDPALAQSLYVESGGNPFYLGQLAAAVSSKAVAAEQPEPAQPWVPKAVSAAIGSEIDDLPLSARSLLQGAAVVGDPFEPELAAEAAGTAAQAALGDLDELLKRDLVRVTASPRSFCFRHPIVRRAVYEAAGAGWRLQAHGRIATVLERRGAAAAARAPHVERAAQFGDVASATVLMQAGQQLIARSPASAAHWFESALGLTPQHQEHVVLRSMLMIQHAMALGLAGKIELARDETRRLLAHPPVELRQQVTMLCVGFELLLGAHAGARRLVLDRLATLEDQPGRDAAELKCELAGTYFFDADWEASRHWATDALACDCHGMVRVGALATLALAEFGLARLDRAQIAASEAAETFEGLDDSEVAAHPGQVIFLGQAEVHTERFADAARHIERSILISRASGQHFLTVGLLAVQIHALAAMGMVTELATVAETATEEALLCTSDPILSMAMSTRAVAGILTGDLHSALRFAERSSSLLTATSPIAEGAQLVLAWVLLEMGEPGRCRQELTSPDGEPRFSPAPLLAGYSYELLIAAELALGDLARAEELALRSTQAAQRLGANVPLAVSLRASAVVSLARGDTQTALAKALESCEVAERAGAQLEAGRSQTLAGRALAANGERTAAIATLRASHEKLLACGASRYSDYAAKQLRELGRAVPRRARAQPGKSNILGLTGREHEVMEHVAAGKRNREIAEALFLSPRTVDRHLARIFQKLNVHSRAAATSKFERANNR